VSFIRHPLGSEYHVQFTARRSWEGNLYYNGAFSEVMPVTWQKDLDINNNTLWVHFTSDWKAARAAKQQGGFDVAVIEEKNNYVATHKVVGDHYKFDYFTALYRVRPNGRSRQVKSQVVLLCDLLRRLYPRPPIVYRW
jgi:hypothetical protein